MLARVDLVERIWPEKRGMEISLILCGMVLDWRDWGLGRYE